MVFIFHHQHANNSGNERGENTLKRAKVGARPCWICGKDARGKYCPPCSADVQDARHHYNYYHPKNKNK